MSIFPAGSIASLQKFIDLCKANPGVLHSPELGFFRTYIETMGGKIPPIPPKATPDTSSKPSSSSPTNDGPDSKSSGGDAASSEAGTPEEEVEEEVIESDVELDTEGVISAESDPPQEMGDADKEVSEEEMDQANDKRGEAQTAFVEGDVPKAVELLTEAIRLNPSSAAFFAKRASYYLKIEKPLSSIRDCDRAIQLNPDNAQAYKCRGRANRLLGRWEEAVKDLAVACKLDYDEEADEWLRDAQPNAKKLAEHRRKYERKREENELKERQRRAQKVREARERAAKQNNDDLGDEDMPPGGGTGGGMPDIAGLLSDPDIREALQDPELAAAFQDISQNPSNILKYQNNPRVYNLMMKMAQKMSGPGGAGPRMPGAGGGFPGGMPGGMPGNFPGFS